MLVWCLLILVFSFFYYFITQNYKYWENRGFKTPKISIPYGSLKNLGTKIPTCLGFNEYYKSFKGKTPAIGLYFFISPALMILDIELIKNIYIREFSTFHDRGFYYNKEDDPMSANLLTLEGQEWKDRRAKLSPVFTSGKMKMMFDIVNSIGDKFVEATDKEISKSPVLEVRQILAKFTTDVISNVAFGLDSNCLEDPNSEFYLQGKRLFGLSSFELMKIFFTSSYPGIAKRLHMYANPKEPSDFLQKVFTQTLKEREQQNSHRNDFVQLLLKLRETTSLSVNEMAAESFIFFAGGFETSSSTLVFSLYELALNEDIQTKLRNEIRDGIDGKNGEISYDLLFSFRYLDMVVKETLRKYPIITGMMRKCNKDYPIPDSDLIIPKGKNVLIPIYSIHHDPDFYPSPDIFDPERFSPENVEQRNPITFLAFGEGPRNCIGSRFGYLQVKIALVKLLMNFHLSPTEKTPIPVKFLPSAPFLNPEGGMWLKVCKLNLNEN